MNSVRLTCANKPYTGEKWLLKRTRKGLVLLDEDENVMSSIPAGEAGLRISFPSFWASRVNLVVTIRSGEEFQFEPRKKEIGQVRTLVEDCSEADPEATAAAYRSKATRDLLIGTGSFVLGVIVTCGSFFLAAPNGKFVVMGGLLGVGLFEIVRGIYFAIKASEHSRLAEADQENDSDEDEDNDKQWA